MCEFSSGWRLTRPVLGVIRREDKIISSPEEDLRLRERRRERFKFRLRLTCSHFTYKQKLLRL